MFDFLVTDHVFFNTKSELLPSHMKGRKKLQPTASITTFNNFLI